MKNEMHFQYTDFGPFDEFHGFIQICNYECPHISGIYLETAFKFVNLNTSVCTACMYSIFI